MNPLWQRFQQYIVRYGEIGFTIDISRMQFGDDFLRSMGARAQKAFSEMRQLESGAIANPDEGRMVGHYWLRHPALAPSAALRYDIEETNARIKKFAADIHAGNITPEQGKFRHLLLIGIGGSALGPQLVADALATAHDPMDACFFDNTDPDGFDRVWPKLNGVLNETLVIVISKSGGAKETRNGMVEAQTHYRAAGLDFARHAVAITGVGSQLDQYAEKKGWLARFPMHDWVGGRTSVMSVVGLLPMALGFDIDQFLAGAAAMDQETRKDVVEQNAAMLLALMWFLCGRRPRDKGYGDFALQGPACSIQQILAATGNGIVRKRNGSRRENRAPGNRRLWQQGIDGSACLCAAAARRGTEFFCHFH
jgi:glucose-6-phosphate isomerase